MFPHKCGDAYPLIKKIFQISQWASVLASIMLHQLFLVHNKAEEPVFHAIQSISSQALCSYCRLTSMVWSFSCLSFDLLVNALSTVCVPVYCFAIFHGALRKSIPSSHYPWCLVWPGVFSLMTDFVALW